jgi:uncharacterized protein
MRFEWDDAKREKVLIERQIDFIDAAILFDGRPIFTFKSPRGEETRFVSVGLLDEKMIAVVWQAREGNIRIITARRARHGEKRAYHLLFPG